MEFHYLFKTQCLIDGASFWGVTSSESMELGTPNQPMTYIGSGAKLKAHIEKYGISNFSVQVLECSPDRAFIERRRNQVLTPEILKDPRCLNTSKEEWAKNISTGMTDLPKSEDHKLSLSVSMQGNTNAEGTVLTPEHKEKVLKNLKRKRINNGIEEKVIEYDPAVGLEEGWKIGAIKPKKD